jgi:hypothetical protein
MRFHTLAARVLSAEVADLEEVRRQILNKLQSARMDGSKIDAPLVRE